MKTQELYVYKLTGELVLVDKEYFYSEHALGDAVIYDATSDCPRLSHRTSQMKSKEEQLSYLFLWCDKIDEWNVE